MDVRTKMAVCCWKLVYGQKNPVKRQTESDLHIHLEMLLVILRKLWSMSNFSKFLL